ncbi:MAG: hypothetical protein J5J06_00195 [Phycisphaerae bacterium]|nr:hypothetical protein [Phycisphaerae bacterium]
MDGSDRIVLDHLDRMTDSTGLLQHAIYAVPRRESGYTTDDNSRALRLCTRLWCRRPEDRMLSRVNAYLSLLEYARRPGGGFHNLLSYQRHWLDTDGDGDCQGQAVRALAELVGSNLPDDHRTLARELIEAVLPTLAGLRSLRAQAYVILAWGHLFAGGAGNVASLECVARSAAQRLIDCFHRSQRPNWPWFESRMTYANAVLPHALFLAAQCWPKEEFLDVAVTSFDFLDRETTNGDIFWPVGNDGWYPHGEEKAPYDQQPVEAGTMADAAFAAFSMLRDETYLDSFCRARDWFHGRNSRGQPLADTRTGSCRDGLQRSGVNRNQGAESTLAYLWTETRNAEVHDSLRETPGPSGERASSEEIHTEVNVTQGNKNAL